MRVAALGAGLGLVVGIACGTPSEADDGDAAETGTEDGGRPGTDASPDDDDDDATDGDDDDDDDSTGDTTGDDDDDDDDDDPPPPPPAECGDSALGQLAASLAAGEYGSLATEGLTDDLMDAGGGHWVTQYTFKGVFDPTWCRVLFTGGGHISLIKFVSYDVASNAWQQEQNPNWWCDPALVPDDPWPCVGHAYGHNAIDPATNRYFYKHGAVEVLELQGAETDAWTSMPAPGGGNAMYTSMDYFPELGGLVLVTYNQDGTGGLQVLDDETGTWSSIDGAFPMGAYHIYSVYNPVHGVVMFGSGNGSASWNLLHADGTVEPASDSPAQFHPEPNDDGIFKVLAVDPAGGDFLAYRQDGALWTYDIDTDAWTDTGATLPPDLELAVPIADYGVVLFMSGRNNEVVVYKHAG